MIRPASILPCMHPIGQFTNDLNGTKCLSLTLSRNPAPMARDLERHEFTLPVLESGLSNSRGNLLERIGSSSAPKRGIS